MHDLERVRFDVAAEGWTEMAQCSVIVDQNYAIKLVLVHAINVMCQLLVQYGFCNVVLERVQVAEINGM